MASQEQSINNSSFENTQVQQVQTSGGDAVSFQNSHHNQVTINKVILRCFGRPEVPKVDWDWAASEVLKPQLTEICKRLKDMLGQDRTLMDISAEEQPLWVNRPLQAKRTLQVDGKDYGLLDTDKLLIETFGRDDIAGKLLILGAPGSGKTTALLDLAEQLVRGALTQPKTVIPVLLELSTWRDDKQSIHDWLIEQLYDLYGGNRKYKRYEAWLEQRVLLPLLDGLDELGLERQKKCTVKLNEFARHYPQIVICCRFWEFETANIILKNLNGAVCLQPLSDQQIQDYLFSQNCSELWSAIEIKPDLQKLLEFDLEGDPGLLRIPLFVKLAINIYNPQQSIQGKRDLLEKYINHQLSPDKKQQDRRKQLEYRDWAYKTIEAESKWRETRKTLNWMARQLQTQKTLDLIIEKIQPDWFESKHLRWSYHILLILFGSFLGSLISIELSESMFGSVIGRQISILNGSPINVKQWGLVWFTFGGMLWGAIAGIDSIKSVESFKFRISKTNKRQIIKNAFSGLKIMGLSIGLGCFVIWGPYVGIVAGLWGGFMSALVCAIFSILLLGLKEELKLRSRPNQGIWNSLQTFSWTVLICYVIILCLSLISIPVLRMAAGKPPWLNPIYIFTVYSPKLWFVGITCAIGFGFIYGGGQACIQHLFLRLVLCHGGIALWNLARFLNYCVERRLLYCVGGRYRFLHRELLDHFAQTRL